MRSAVGLPPALSQAGRNVLRPRDAGHVYAQPWTEFKRLAARGVLHKVTTGYYVIVPQDRIGDGRWRPDLEGVALGIAQADYGSGGAVLMGPSAARLHGVYPRALRLAVVGVPVQRPRLRTSVGEVLFVKRDVGRLDVERTRADIGNGWVTTVEQTLVDLAARPALGGLPGADIADAVRGLAARASWPLVRRLAREQHKPRALRYAADIVGLRDA